MSSSSFLGYQKFMPKYPIPQKYCLIPINLIESQQMTIKTNRAIHTKFVVEPT